MNSFILLAAADGPVEQISKTFGANIPALVANAISFVLVGLVIKLWVVGPVQKMLEERRTRIQEGLANAEKSRVELANAQTKVQELLNQAATQSNKIIEEARAAAAKISETEAQKAVTQAQDIIAKARQANEAELVRMKEELRREVGRLVVQATTKVTGKILTLDDQKRLAEEANRQLAA
ncbi:MAG TPA: F0F1 ATP synthase subunit B [Candidatus Limnocylindria bacterium]|nr:F0F1 ATP synthase subunit B [Candidatus Limnocylindria bacterium]